LIGCYIASGRNQMVENHYRRLGFELAAVDDGGTTWAIAVERAGEVSLPFVRRVTV
jgi:predicted enzyme involved in methoxymalonyl-ACP biosynthesis